MLETLFIKFKKLKIKNSHTLCMRSGQSLIEVLIGLTIGALLIGTAAMGVAFMLRSTSANDNLQMASGMVQASLDKARAFAGANWQNIYGLTKGTSTTYFLNSSSTEFFLVEGKEGVVGTDVVDGLVGRWGFDEATGTVAYDMSGNNNNGTLINNPTNATSTCKIGYCLNFNGTSQYVSVPSVDTFDLVGTGSIIAWIKIDSTWVGSLYPNVVSKGANAGWDTGGWSLFVFNPISDRRIGVGFRNGVTTKSVSFTNTLTDQWVQIAGIWDGSYIYLYENGVQKASSTQTISPQITTYPVTIGRDNGSQYFDGSVDDVRIYNRALSADEVKRMYESSVFSRYFTVENVCRTNDASSTVSGVTPCGSGSLEDPSTQKISSVVEWIASTGATNLTLVDYITRWKNAIFQQTDWSGGSGDDAIYTEPGSGYSSSTNIDSGSGLIRLHGI